MALCGPYQISKSTRDNLLRNFTDGSAFADNGSWRLEGREPQTCGRCAGCVLRPDGRLLFFIFVCVAFLVMGGLGKRRRRFVIASRSESNGRGDVVQAMVGVLQKMLCKSWQAPGHPPGAPRYRVEVRLASALTAPVDSTLFYGAIYFRLDTNYRSADRAFNPRHTI